MNKTVNLTRYIDPINSGHYDNDEIIQLIVKKINEVIEEYNDLKEILFVKAITNVNEFKIGT